MDPVTAAINAVAAFVTLQSEIFAALPPEQKAQYAADWAARQQAWHDFWSRVFDLASHK